MITIVDVAARAGVSVATVSRVLNYSYAVTQEKKDLVMEAIKSTGYVIPQRMKISKKLQDGRILLTITGTQIGTILDAIHAQALSFDYQPLTYSYHSRNDLGNLKNLLKNLSEKIAGIILLNSIDSSMEFEELLSSYPVVQIGDGFFHEHPNYTVYNDEISMAYDATSYLLNSGKKELAILTMNSTNLDFFSGNKREKGFFLALMDHQQKIDESHRLYTDVTIEGGYEATFKLLELHPQTQGILCTNDAIALGALHALETKGISLEQIQPISLDYNEIWELFHPFLPYVDPHHRPMGAAAVSMLHSLICNEEVLDRSRIIPHELVTSSSHP